MDWHDTAYNSVGLVTGFSGPVEGNNPALDYTGRLYSVAESGPQVVLAVGRCGGPNVDYLGLLAGGQ